jgi:hypothetical protein
MGCQCLQCNTAVVSGFVVLRILIIETYSLTEFANGDVHLESVTDRVSKFAKNEIIADLNRTCCED